MQISKLLSAFCAVALCAAFVPVQAQDNPAQSAARAALMEKMNQFETAPEGVTPPPAYPTNAVTAPTRTVVAPSPPAKPAPAPVVVHTAPATTNAGSQPKATVPAKSENPGTATERTVPVVTAPEQPQPAPQPPPIVRPTPPPPANGLSPIQAPSSVTPAKQAKLDALLQQYKADQITPEQYQAERAKILAGP